MQVVITIEGSQADVLEQEPDEQVQFHHLGSIAASTAAACSPIPRAS